jgi:hypothetical protein
MLGPDTNDAPRLAEQHEPLLQRSYGHPDAQVNHDTAPVKGCATNVVMTGRQSARGVSTNHPEADFN